MRLDDALADLQAIQDQLRRTRAVTCYRSATVGFSGVLALVVAGFQPYVVEDARNSPVEYVLVWSLVAGLSLLAIAVDISSRYWTKISALARAQTRATLSEFAPCVLAGGVLTWVIVFHCLKFAPLLPALWSIFFALGLLTTRHRWPPMAFWVGIHYLLAGIMCARFAGGQQAFAPWMMAITFGCGQLLAAVVLHQYQEHGRVKTK